MVAIGDIITFRYPVSPQTRATEASPKVLVLHDNWQGFVHGVRLNYKYMTPDQENMLKMLMSPKFQDENKASLMRRNPVLMKEYDEIVAKAQRTPITSPHDFYLRAIKPFISPRDYEPYRRYRPSLMSNIVIVEAYSSIMNPKQEGLFAKLKNTLSGWRGPRFRGPPV